MSQPAIDPQDTLPQAPDSQTVKQPPAQPQRLTVRSFGLSNPGRVRSSNEDQFLIAELTKAMRIVQSSLPQAPTKYSDERAYLFVVADGMGGVEGGEQASALAVHSLEEFVLNTFKWFFHLQGGEQQDALSEFRTALGQADARVIEQAVRHPNLQGMGTTLTMAYSIESELFVVHVGDSRCYLFRGGALHRLTHDHTLVQELVSRGEIQPEQAPHHRLRHVITNVVGGHDPGVQVEVHNLGLEPADVLLLCSDGLTEMVPEEEVAAILHAGLDLRATCEQLVARANDQGGRDNITVVLARFEPPT